MKFDKDGKKIVVKSGVSLSEEFLNKVKSDIKIVAEFLKTSIPDAQLQNGYGGKCLRSKNTISIGFGNGTHDNKTREIIVHEMLHHKGYDHGRVNGHLFMSHAENDHISPILVEKIFA